MQTNKKFATNARMHSSADTRLAVDLRASDEQHPIDATTLGISNYLTDPHSTNPTSLSDDLAREHSGAQMPNTAASTQVGETAELVELILSHLSVLNIVTSSGVNKTFRNTILNSHTLQRKLFLRPVNPPTQYWVPLQRLQLSTLFRTVTAEDATGDRAFEPTHESRMTVHELPMKVVSVCPLLGRPSVAQGLWARCEPPETRLQWKSFSTSPNQWYFLKTKEITGSWKRMFLTNPPCKSVRCTLLWEGWVRGVLNITLEATRLVYRQAGVRYADLLEQTCKTPGLVDINTAYNDEMDYCIPQPYEGGGYQYHVSNTSLLEEIKRCRQRNGERRMRLNSHSTVALQWAVALTNDERSELAAKVDDKFFFSPNVKTAEILNARRSLDQGDIKAARSHFISMARQPPVDTGLQPPQIPTNLQRHNSNN